MSFVADTGCTQVSNQIAWLCIGVASFRFRLAWKKQGRTAEQLRYPNPLGIYGGLVIIGATTFIILVQGWTVFRGTFSGVDFVANYSASLPCSLCTRLAAHPGLRAVELPIFAGLYLFWRLLKGVRTPSLSQIDLDSGRYVQTEDDEVDDLARAEREKGRMGWAWRMYGWVA